MTVHALPTQTIAIAEGTLSISPDHTLSLDWVYIAEKAPSVRSTWLCCVIGETDYFRRILLLPEPSRM